MIARTTKVTDSTAGLLPIGTEVTHKEAWRLVVAGVAEPADKECQETIDALAEREAAAAERREFVAAERDSLTAKQQPKQITLPADDDDESDPNADHAEDAT